MGGTCVPGPHGGPGCGRQEEFIPSHSEQLPGDICQTWWIACVRVCMRACTRACMRVCVRVCGGGNCANSLGNKVFNLRDTSMQPDSQEIRPQIGNISSISRCILFLKICCFFFTQTQKDKYSVIPPLLRSPGLSDSQRQKQVGGRGRAGAGRTCQTGTECRFEKMSRSWRRRR